MNSLLRRARHRRNLDQGLTLPELLTVMFILALVGLIIAGVVIQALKVTRITTSGAEGQSQLNDAVTRIARDIAAADPILHTPTTAGWATETPAARELWVQNTYDSRCVRTRYYTATEDGKTTLNSTTATYPVGAGCPDPRRPDTSVPATATTVTKTLIADFKAPANGKVFTYYDNASTELTAPVSRGNVDRIARVKIDVGANVRERPNGVRLVTSVAPRSIDNPLITNVPPPSCMQANLRAATDGFRPATPVVRYDAADNTDTYTLRRLSPNPTAWTPTTTAPGMVTDTGMRGRHSMTVRYALEMTGPGGDITCETTVEMPPGENPNAPAVSGQVIPVTLAPAVVSSTGITLTWPAVPNATRYEVSRRPINEATYAPTGTGVWTLAHTTTSVSWTDRPGYDQAFQYKVVAYNDNYIPATVSTDSNTVHALTHTTGTTVTGQATDYGVNTLTWTRATGTSFDGYRVFRRVSGTTDWGTPIGTIANRDQLTWEERNVPLGSRHDYLVAPYNIGPRGSTVPASGPADDPDRNLAYYATITGATATILQYPDVPTITVTGTENTANPDGTNRATWTPVDSATSYQLWELDTPDGPATTQTATGTTRTATDTTGNPRGSRSYYTAVAYNATGPSKNAPDASVRAASARPAYQRPATPGANPTARPSLATNNTTLTYTRTGDQGEPTDKFCDTASLCTYNLARTGTGTNTTATQQGTTAGTYTHNANDGNASPMWGSTGTWTINACNPGGCSEDSTTRVDHYPGPYSPSHAFMKTEMDHHQWWEPNSYNDHTRTGDGQSASGDASWTNSAGVRASGPYRLRVDEKIDDPMNYFINTLVEDSKSGERFLTPGASYDYSITAYAPNGLTRDINFDVQYPPAPTVFFETTRVCRASMTDPARNVNDGWWKAASRFRYTVGMNRPGGLTQTHETNFAYTDVVGKRTNPTYAEFADWVNAAEIAGGDRQGTTSQWNTMTAGTFFFRNRVLGQGSDAMSPEFTMVNGNYSNDGWYMPEHYGTGAMARVRTQVAKTPGHDTLFGDWTSAAVSDVEYVNDPVNRNVQCDGVDTWHGLGNFISRWALRGSADAVNPNTTAGARWAYFNGRIN